MDIIDKIKDVINNVRPYLINDGGDVEFIKYENNFVYIHMKGTCSQCQMLDVTLKDGIECILKEEIPEIVGVINV